MDVPDIDAGVQSDTSTDGLALVICDDGKSTASTCATMALPSSTR
jgi:hypothetical protein